MTDTRNKEGNVPTPFTNSMMMRPDIGSPAWVGCAEIGMRNLERELAEKILALSEETERYALLRSELDKLKDPAVVLVNMMRGTIAPISMAACASVHGEQTVRDYHAAMDCVSYVEGLKETASKVLEGFAEGAFVREVAMDHTSAWAMRLLPYIAALGRLDALAKNPNGAKANIPSADGARTTDNGPGAAGSSTISETEIDNVWERCPRRACQRRRKCLSPDDCKAPK